MRRRFFALLLSGLALGEAAGAVPETKDEAATPAPRSFVTHHHGEFRGGTFDYTVIAEDMIMKNADGDPAASLFSFTYLKDGIKDPATRPVMFVFNGGPGSSSAWLHVGGIGPRRVQFQQPNGSISAPVKAVDNPDSVLEAADLVFIDPVGTGYSRLFKTGKGEDYWSNEADAHSVALFIERWLGKHHRFQSPKFLLGESYGTVRAAIVSQLLTGGVSAEHFPSISLNGIILVGQDLSPAQDVFRGNDLAYAMLLPSEAATAWYHGKVEKNGQTLESFVAEVRKFAATDYLAALYQGDQLTAQARDAVVAAMTHYLGLPRQIILSHDLRIDRTEFADVVLADRGLTTGVYDSRFVTQHTPIDRDVVGDDASMVQTGAPAGNMLQDYMSRELGIGIDDTYEFINWKVGHAWKRSFGDAGIEYGDKLTSALRQNPAMRLFVGGGYYDLVTPIGAAEHMVSHAALPRGRVTLHFYNAGHEVYVGDDNARQFNRDIQDFAHAALTR